ncbi:MAG TPA: CHAD domain-containing protein [Acidimicrobiia bacterium]
MGFSIRPSEPVGDEVCRVLQEQVGSALDHLRDPGAAGIDTAVHEARKSCKRLRAVYRLVRPALSANRYQTLNHTVRDAAQELSGARDAKALVDMFDDLVAAHRADPAEEELRMVRAALTDRAEAVADDGGSEGAVRRAVERLELVAELTARTNPRGRGFEVLRRGLQATYGDGRGALGRFRAEPSPELSHEWRKSVKYTWHHVELLESTAPSVLTPGSRALHDLSDALGDAHNLAVLGELVADHPTRFGGPAAADRVAKMAADCRADLERRAVRLGLRIYAETPKAFGRRLGGYWAAATDGSELVTGELADVVKAERDG